MILKQFFNHQDPWSYEEDHQFLEAFFTKLFSNLRWWENFQKDAKEFYHILQNG